MNRTAGEMGGKIPLQFAKEIIHNEQDTRFSQELLPELQGFHHIRIVRLGWGHEKREAGHCLVQPHAFLV